MLTYLVCFENINWQNPILHLVVPLKSLQIGRLCEVYDPGQQGSAVAVTAESIINTSQ